MRLPTPAAHHYLKYAFSLGLSSRLQHCTQRSRDNATI